MISIIKDAVEHTYATFIGNTYNYLHFLNDILGKAMIVLDSI